MAKAKQKVLWVDDDAVFINAQIQEVERNYEVEIARGPDDFLQLITRHSPDYYVGFIMDVMLPYGETISTENANGGLNTGIALIEQIKLMIEFRDKPILIFTIRYSSDVDDFASKHGIIVIRKQESLDEFSEAVRKTFGV